MSKNTALITGITGQDGSYLAELLLEKNYRVVGIRRRSSSPNTERIDHLRNNENLFLEYGDLSDVVSLISVLKKYDPSEIYNLGAMSHVRISFDLPYYSLDVDGAGTLRLLEAARLHSKEIKIYQASTSELYGKVLESPQNEATPFNPQSPYAIAKQYAFHISRMYRDSYNMFVVNGILFNHESPRRGDNFITQKIIKEAKRILNGQIQSMTLGNIYSVRDWGHAKDYVRAMYMMMQSEVPKDYVVATGEVCSVKDFVLKVFSSLGVLLEFKGEGMSEHALIKELDQSLMSKFGMFSGNVQVGQVILTIDEYYFRPAEVEYLHGDSSLIRRDLGWLPQYNLESLIMDMINAEFDVY